MTTKGRVRAEYTDQTITIEDHVNIHSPDYRPWRRDTCDALGPCYLLFCLSPDPPQSVGIRACLGQGLGNIG